MSYVAEKVDAISVHNGQEKSGAEIAIDVLNELGVEYIFGHTGGAVIPLHVELNMRMEQGRKAPEFVLS